MKKWVIPVFSVLSLIRVTTTTFVIPEKQASADGTNPPDYDDPLGLNIPIGLAQGIIPGRVVGMHNEDSTNGNCGHWVYGDEYFLDKNAIQQLVDKMLQAAMLGVTREASEEDA